MIHHVSVDVSDLESRRPLLRRRARLARLAPPARRRRRRSAGASSGPSSSPRSHAHRRARAAATSASAASGIPAVKAAWEAGVRPAAPTTGRPARGPSTVRATTRRTCSTRTGTGSRSPSETTDRTTSRETAQMAKVKVGINGFGRIGRNLFRAAHEAGAELEFVAVNDITDARLARPPAQVRLDPTAASPARSRPATDSITVDGAEIKVLSERDPGDLPVGRTRRRRRDRVDRPVHQARRRRQAPRGRRQEGDHLGAGHRPRRDRRARRQLRRRLRPREPPHHLQRLLHDQLPGAGREGAQRDGRDRARADDHDPRLHRRPAPPGHARTRTCAGRGRRRST